MLCAKGLRNMRLESLTDSKTSWQLARFILVGALNTIVGLTTILILHLRMGFDVAVANVIGYGTGLIISFALNGRWTFQKDTLTIINFSFFALLVLIAFICSLSILNYLMSLGVPYVVAQSIGVISYSLLLFLGMKHVVYRSKARDN